MTLRLFVSATSGRGAVQTDVGGNIFKLQLNPQQLMSQGCDSQAETTWHEGHAAPAPSACSACIGAAHSCPPRSSPALPGQPAVLLQEPAAAVQALQPPATARGTTAVQAVGTCVTSEANPVSITDSVAWRPTHPLNPLNCVSRVKGGWRCVFIPLCWFK